MSIVSLVSSRTYEAFSGSPDTRLAPPFGFMEDEDALDLYQNIA